MASSSISTPKPKSSEDILSEKTDVCIANFLVKSGIGAGVGILASAILFRRRPWPVFFATGWGAGSAYSDCNRLYNPASLPGYKIAGSTKESS